MRLKLNIHIIFLLAFPSWIQCQLNGVKIGLQSCYNESAIPGITIANNRPPVTLNIFLEILRRLEDANPTVTIRDMSLLILQRLKQNGIDDTGKSVNINIGLSYAPIGQDAIKGTLIADNFIPATQLSLSYGDLAMSDVCAFHYMISNTINATLRGDESQTCVRSARYQMRMTRDLGQKNTDIEPVERVGTSLQSFFPRGELSRCPIEKGVIYTQYGTVKIGTVIQGLAAGLNPQNVFNVDSRYAATLTGDLCQAALIQMDSPLQLGAQGGWNSTTNQKYFFLQQNDRLELTDQDIRGSLDGLFLALKISDIRQKTDIKLSQILDMYYSPYQKGVFDSSLRACNRNILYSEIVNSQTLKQSIINLMPKFDQIGQYPGTVEASGYQTLSEAAFNNFSSYLPNLKDPDCPQIDSGIERVRTDLLIFLDPNWDYRVVQPVLSYILDNIDVNKFGSRYTLFSGVDGTNITNSSTSYLLEFHNKYNLSVHENMTKNFDYSKIYETLEWIAKSKLNNNSYTGGESTIALIVPSNPPNANQRVFLDQRKEIIRRYLPDLSIIVLGSGVSGDYSSMLSNPAKDFVSLSNNDNDGKQVAQNVVNAIKSVPRSLVNPSCGSGFSGSENTFTYSDSVDLNGINYYKISPFYFGVGSKERSLRITESNTGSITVCLSRDHSKPTNQTGDCQTIRSNANSYDISSYCGKDVLDCAPIYLSIYGNTTQYRCTDSTCRFPNNIKYSITLNSVGCTSSAVAIFSNFVLVAMLFLFLKF